jgi:PAS domain S-box-containing protein
MAYLLALVGPAATFAIKVTVAHDVPASYLLFCPAVALAAVLGGLVPGLVATVVSMGVVGAWVLAPVGDFDIHHAHDLTRAALFVLTGAIMSVGVDAARRKSRENATLVMNETTLRIARDEALTKAQELQAVLDAVPAVVLIARDPKSRTMRVNKFGAAVLGVEPDVNVSKTAQENSPPLAYRLMRDGVEIPPDQLPMNLVSSKAVDVKGATLEVVMSDGKVTYLFGNAAPLRDASGEVCGAVSAMVDVTEARQGDDRLRAFLTSGPDVLVVVDADGKHAFVSPNVESMLGRKVSEVTGQSILRNVHPEDRERMAKTLGEACTVPGAMGHGECRVLRADGTWRVIEISGRNLLQNPAVHGVLLNLRDVTEQRDLEAKYRQAQRMENVGRLAGGIAHDFNNVLTVILAAVAEMKQSNKSGDRFDQELVEEIEEAGLRARDLTRQLLLFARRRVASPVPLDLNDALMKTLSMLRRLLGEHIEVTAQLASDLGSVVCDPVQVEQVVVNLSVNARDAMSGGGRLTLETRNVDVTPADVVRNSDLRPGQWVMLAVRDSGTGLSAEARAHLFEPFFTTKTQGRGTGLGLATVQGIVEHSGGHIAVRSEVGKGASFELYFPRTSQPAQYAAAVPPVGESAGGKETVLVVEDEPGVREIVARTLRNNGYEVLTAEDGLKALELGADDVARLHLVVTDIMMPGANGRQVVEKLREQIPGLPALFISGYTEDISAMESISDARTQFLAKPFSPAELLAKARATLAGA